MKSNEDNITFGKETFVFRTKGRIFDDYEKKEKLGEGSYGSVYRVKNKTTGEIRACKELLKTKISDIEKFEIEISIMAKADHPSIIKLYEIYDDTRNFYLVMEECKGGELFDRISDKIDSGEMYSEKEACKIFIQMMSAIAYCHSIKICHRDLKPENILFLTKDEDSQIKVIDFGLSKIYGTAKTNNMKTKVGTAYYVSPEVLMGNYDEKCDIWSAGVILYILLSGEPPFNGEEDNDIYSAIMRKEYDFPDEQWQNISREAIDLIKNMLCEPSKRFTAEQVLAHPWIKKSAPNSKGRLTNINIENIKKYKNANKLKKAVMTFIASRLKDEEVENLRNVFNEIDKNKDGTITLQELKEGISKVSHLKSSDVETIFNNIDTDKSGKIEYTEFISATMDKKLYMKEERLREAFLMLDIDHSGKISKDELKKILKINEIDDASLNKYIEQFDINHDGEIDYDEFLNMMG